VSRVYSRSRCGKIAGNASRLACILRVRMYIYIRMRRFMHQHTRAFKVTWRETAWIHQIPSSEAPGPGAYDLLAVDRLTWARAPAPKFGKAEQV
jgi:hypothetical protein